ncbi:MAG: hypothetical protein EOP48_16810, partial [Sphingobacteriales bacterium]
MNEFSITTRLTAKEYTKLMYVGLYRKPAFILATLLGLYYLTTIILDYLKVINWYEETPTFEMLCGLFLFLAPTLIVLIALRQFTSNPCFRNDISYTFSNNGVTCKGSTFKS